MSTITPEQALSIIPDGLRVPLISEYRSLVQNFMERRWTPAELSGGRFCEIVYTILHGYGTGTYATGPSKPKDFVGACRQLENNASAPRSFQILVPRILPALYEIRNNRGVGHVGGDVDPNHMDATAVLSLTSWVMAEMVRVFHGLDVGDAQKVVDSLVERRMPLVWSGAGVKRVLDPSLPLKEQVLLLICSSLTEEKIVDLFVWIDYKNKPYFMKTLRSMHAARLIELSADEKAVQILPPGAAIIEKKIAKLSA